MSLAFLDDQWAMGGGGDITDVWNIPAVGQEGRPEQLYL